MKQRRFSAIFALFLSTIFLTACSDPTKTTSVSPEQIAAAKKSVSGTLKNKGALKFAAAGGGRTASNKPMFKAMFKHDDTPHLTCYENGDGTFTAEQENADGSGTTKIYIGDFSEDANGVCTLGTEVSEVGGGTSPPPSFTDPNASDLTLASIKTTCVDNAQVTADAVYFSFGGTGPGYLFSETSLYNDKGTELPTDDYSADWGYSDYAFDGVTSRESYCLSYSTTPTGISGTFVGTDFSDQGFTPLTQYTFTFNENEANGSFTATGTVTYAADNSTEKWEIAYSGTGDVTVAITYSGDNSVLRITFNEETGVGGGTYTEADGTKIADVTITPNSDGTSTWKMVYADGSSETFIG